MAIKEEIVTGIRNDGKTIIVSFSWMTNDKCLERDNPNYENILEILFEALINRKRIILDICMNRINNVKLTDESAENFHV